MQTVPTGVSSVPPEGPATPVVATAWLAAGVRASAPRAIASATASLTTPSEAISSSGTPSQSIFCEV